MDLSQASFDQIKSYWREKQVDAWTFYCPFCKVPRKVPYRPRPTQKHLMQVFLVSLAFTGAFWKVFAWKGLVSFLPLWILFEFVYRLQVRGALYCSQCGFDPYLYLVDVKRAKSEIRDFWRKKFEERGIPFPEASGQPQAPQKNPPSEAASDLTENAPGR